jgi:tetratricopeptide (TPR) repeat protein
VLGREFGLDVLARLAGVPENALLEALDEAIAARVLADVPGAPGRLRFAHVLIRDTLYEGLTSARRLRLHRDVVAVLDERDAAELAAHALAARDHPSAVRFARAGAAHAREQRAYDEAARLFRLALEAEPQPAERGELLLAAGDALAKAGSTADAKATFLSACELEDFFARAALGYGGGVVWQRAGHDARLVPLLEEALARLPEDDSILRAKLLARLAGALRDEPSLDRRCALSREAVAMARRLGDDDTLAGALTSLFMATWGPDVDELRPIAAELSGLAARCGSRDAILNALTVEALVRWLTFDEVEPTEQEYDALAGQLGEAHLRWQGAMQNAHAALFRGDFAAAERLEEAARRIGGADADCSYRLAMFILRREQGRLVEVEELLRDAVPAYPGYRAFRCIVPVLEWELGRERAARRAFDELAARGFAALPRDSEWLFCLALLAEVAVWLEDREAAEVLYALLKPYARVNAMAAGEVALGPVARHLGILAAATERWEEAAAYFEEALALNAQVGARPWVERTRADQARMRGHQPGTESR